MTGLGIGLLATAMIFSGSVEARTALDPDRLYGRVRTSEGETIEGYMRWGLTESHWVDVLDAFKQIPLEWEREAESLDPEYAEERRRARTLVAFGIRLTWDVDDDEDLRLSESGIRFIHVRSVVPIDARSALVTLTSGEELTLRSAPSNIGRTMRAVEVEVPGAEVIEVPWQDLERVDFMEAPARVPAPSDQRLFGTVETWSNATFTGFVSWDLDEIFDTDVLDGREHGVDREILFGDIRRIEWASDRSARVYLRRGDELELRGTNDVDRNNRGIEISDPHFGRLTVRWKDFKSIAFETPAQPTPRPSFEPGSPIWGVVMARDGRVIEGEIRWGNNKAQWWEFLDDWSGDLDFDIEFGAIQEMRKATEHRVVLLLRDGRRLEVEGTAEAEGRHRGVFVKPEGRARRLVRWRDVDRVVFSR